MITHQRASLLPSMRLLACLMVLVLFSATVQSNPARVDFQPPASQKSDSDPRSSLGAPGGATLLAPPRAAMVVPRGYEAGPHYGNLRYEGNNISMRGPLDPHGFPLDSGQQIAKRWKRFARAVAGVFVLRDSLFSQQDNPLKHHSKALMLPPNWITVAVSAARRGGALKAVQLIPLDNDAAWSAINSPGALFGDFPASNVLFREACRPMQDASPTAKRRTLFAREAVTELGNQSRALIEALPRGAEVVAQVGAELIVASDARYFGAKLRRTRIIPIFVENPTPAEMAEGKGTATADNPYITAADVDLVTRVVYARRLLEGDLALERYDISKPSERKRAINLLSQLIPREPTFAGGGLVWLWVTGPLVRGAKLKGENATAYIEAFKAEVAATSINTARLRYLSKPMVLLPPGKSRQASFDATLDQFAALQLWLSIDLNSITLNRLLTVHGF